MKKVSMKDIARELGVSVALVSYVLNEKFTNRINADTAERIRKLAKKYNYTPNQIAKSLKSNKTNTIGLIVADISNFFYSYIAGFIEEEAESKGYSVLFASAYEDPTKFKKLLDIMIARQVDGLILAVPDGAEDCLDSISNLSIPFVIIDREFPSYENLETICLDNFSASSSVVKKMDELNCQNIAAISLDNNLFHLQERGRGFIETANKSISIQHASLFKVSENRIVEEVESALKRVIFEDKIDAICFFTNKIAMAALPLLLSYKIKIPHDLMVICYDEVEAYKLFSYPLFFVRQPLKEMSIDAVQLLFKNNSNKKVKRFKAELVEMKGH